jgi:hypothetical protein
MSYVVSHTKRPTAVVLLLCTFFVMLTSHAVRAHDVNPTPVHLWCIARNNLPPECSHYLFTCRISAFLTGGACVKVAPTTTKVVATPVRQKVNAAPRKLSAAMQDQLFHEFVEWKRTNR